MNEYILMADDDTEDQELLSEAFAELGSPISLSFVSSGQELLDSLTEVTVAPSLIVLDLNMPKMNGFQVLGTLKKDPKTTNIPVIVYTTSSKEDAEKLSLAKGAIRFINKPDSIAGLAAIARQIASLIKT